MDDSQSCLTCKFWFNEDNNAIGECRRHAPMVLEKHGFPIYPQVDYQHWCGDYIEKQASPKEGA